MREVVGEGGGEREREVVGEGGGEMEREVVGDGGVGGRGSEKGEVVRGSQRW